MLYNWEPHDNYQKKLLLNLKMFCETERSRVIFMNNTLSKLYFLDLDNLLPAIKPLYSDFGRTAKNQQGIIKSLVLMLDCKYHSIINWAQKIDSDRLLCAVCGFETGPRSIFFLVLQSY